MRPVAGLPLIHVEKPSYHGAKRSGKRLFDVAFSVAALLVLLPLFAVVAVAIKLDNKVLCSTGQNELVWTVGRSG